jgi:large subunit ribosomal protein L29
MAKGLTAEDLRTQPEEELVTKLKEAKEELFNLRFQAATGQLESHGRLRMVRRDIARIYTVLRERELGIIGFIEPEEAPAADEPEAEAEEPKPKKKSTKKSTAKKANADDAETDTPDEGAPADAEGDAK